MERNLRLMRKSLLMASCAAMTFSVSPVQAQDSASAEEEIEMITVTGSRIRRDAFTSAAPIQTFDIEAAKQIGITSIGELLGRATVANGQQFDATLNTNAGNSNASEAPPSGGVGSANIGLRGLGPERTLVLLNGRRLGSSGVRGAPSQPDLNLIPLNLVERVDVVTEGASSIYGADAVAGVINLQLRDEFEGMEVSGNFEFPEVGKGETYQVSFLTGAQTDNSSIVFAAEFTERRRLPVSAHRDCVEALRIDQQGNRLDNCSNGFFDNSVIDLSGASDDLFVWYTPGSTDIGVPNFSSAHALPDNPDTRFGSDRASERDKYLTLPQYSDVDERLAADLIQPVTLFSAVTLGKYQVPGLEDNLELYYEAYYMNRHLQSRASTEQIFPVVPGLIQQEDANGNIIVDGTGAPILVDNPLNPFNGDAAPLITIEDLPQLRDVELQQFRIVGGARGALPGGWAEEGNWAYDIYASYDRGVGYQSQPFMNEENLLLFLNTLRLDSDGNPTCGTVPGTSFGFTTPQDCVIIDFFNPSLFEGGETGEGVFATDEERNFLIGTRTNRTVVEQFIAATSFTGDLFEIPGGGVVGLAFGGEYRKDSIKSTTDFLGASGGVAAENPLTEGATIGSRNIYDIYAEINAPLIVDKPGVNYLGVEGAIRHTDESNFGSETTYRARFTYRPVDWVSLSGSYGTSFRAPNLREQFLADQFQGVGSDSDPCSVPAEANDGGIYNAAQDNRSQTLLDNCAAFGADPTQLGLVASVTIPVTVGGNPEDLVAETSRTYTATLQLSPKISDSFDVDFAISYWDISIDDTVRSLAATTILTRCFQDAPNLASPFCSRLTPGVNPNPNFNFVSAIDASFLNLGNETAAGFDINARFRTAIDDVAGEQLDIGWSVAWTQQTDRTETIFTEDPQDDLLGDFGNPKTRINSTLSFVWSNWEALFSTRYLSGTTAGTVARIDAECDTFDDPTSVLGTDLYKPVCDAASRWYQDVSFAYRQDTWSLTFGVNNLFDKLPPRISGGAGSNRANLVTSSGYDLTGRSYFMNVAFAF